MEAIKGVYFGYIGWIHHSNYYNFISSQGVLVPQVKLHSEKSWISWISIGFGNICGETKEGRVEEDGVLSC